MRLSLPTIKKIDSEAYKLYTKPLKMTLQDAPALSACGDSPLKMTFEDQSSSLIYFNIEEHEFARVLAQDLKHNEFAKA